jgi:hypothetical protein
LKTFDQWEESLSKEIFFLNDQKDTKIFWNMSDIFDEDSGEEEKVKETKRARDVRGRVRL